LRTDSSGLVSELMRPGRPPDSYLDERGATETLRDAPTFRTSFSSLRDTGPPRRGCRHP
jgi:hypothetical protein